MKRLALLFILFAPSAWGACTGSSPTWTSTPDQPSVASCVASASTGDTINISAGTATWTNGVTISGKSLKIVGAGSGRIIAISQDVLAIATGTLTVNTIAARADGSFPLGPTNGQTLRVFQTGARTNWMQGTVTSFNSTTGVLVMNITSTSGTGASYQHHWCISTVPQTILINNSTSTSLFSVTEDTSLDTSLSGFKVAKGTGTQPSISFNIATGGKPIIVHDCWFEQNQANTFGDANTNRGLIYNNSFDASPFSMQFGTFDIKSNSSAITNSWTTASTWGTADTTGQGNFYIETNDYHAYLVGNATDDNGRLVFRYNFLDDAGFGTHGADTSPYGQRYVEFYNNRGVHHGWSDGSTFNMTNGWFLLRGGSMIMHDNNLDAIAGGNDFAPAPDLKASVFNLREGANNPSDSCWGAGTAAGSLYHAPRQVGMGRVTGTGLDGKGRNTDETTYVGDSEPIYIWNNSRNPMTVSIFDVNPPTAQCTAIGTPDVSANYIKLNRDYFQGTAKPSYTPYPYPHPLTNSAAAPVLSFSPASFGNQTVNTTSSPINVTISNVGNAAETYSSIALSPGVFVNGNTGLAGQCAASGTIGAGANCVVKVTFTPTAVQSYNGTITMTGTVNGSGAITGTGSSGVTPPGTPTNLTSSVSGLTVTLNWTASIGTPTITYNCQVSSVGASGPFSTFTTTLTTSCQSTAVSGGAYWFRVSATNSAGTSAATAPIAVILTAPSAIATLAPSAMSFPASASGTPVSTNCNSSASCTVVLSNTGTASLTITSISIAGPNAPDFTNTTTCGGTLAPSASCNIPVTFTPSTTGVPETASIVLVSNDPNSPDTVTLSGIGFIPVSVSPISLNFGNQFLKKASSARNVTITNNSAGTLTFTVPPALTTGTQYAISSSTCGGTVLSGANCAISITFTPTSIGIQTDTLTFTFTGPPGSPIPVAISGTGKKHGVLRVGAAVNWPYGGAEIIQTVLRPWKRDESIVVGI